LPILRQIAYRLALERYEMGDHDGALAPAEKAFRWCRELNDQPGNMKAAILLLRICSGDDVRNWYEELRQLASTTCFRLERACAYWELGLSDESRDESVSFLENSYELYRSVPFVDSRRSAEMVKRSIDVWVGTRGGHGVPPLQLFPGSSSVDATFDALMQYVPQVSVC
jgi:hypothetical protein